MMPLFRRSEKFDFFEGSSHFSFVCNDLGRKNRESAKSEIYNSAELRNQGSYDFYEAYLQFHFGEATVSVTNNFFFLRVFNKVRLRNNNSEMARAKSESLLWVGKLGKGK